MEPLLKFSIYFKCVLLSNPLRELISIYLGSIPFTQPQINVGNSICITPQQDILERLMAQSTCI